jgi:hypothetical protein
MFSLAFLIKRIVNYLNFSAPTEAPEEEYVTLYIEQSNNEYILKGKKSDNSNITLLENGIR